MPGWTTPANLADEASAALAQLCRQTMWDDDVHGYDEPADVYATLGALCQAVQALPQVIDQAAVWLQREGRNGRAGYDGDGTDQDLPQAVADLGHAEQIAAYLATVLSQATQHAAHLTGITPDPADPDAGDPDD